MTNHETTFRYIGIAAIILLLVGLVGWYLFVSRQTANIEDLGAGRGFSIDVPSFTGSRSSTAENIAFGFGASLPAQQTVGETRRPPRLWRVSATPVAGAGFVTDSSGTATLRFVERSTGNVFDADPETGEVVRRTNTLMPRIYEALVGAEESIVLRYLDEDGGLATFTGSISTTTAEEDGSSPLLGDNLGIGMRDVALSSDANLVFLTHDADGTRLVRAALDGTGPEELGAFAAGGFNLRTLSDGRIILVEKAGSGVPGIAYEVGENGSLVPLVRNIPGLTLVPRANSTAVLIGTDTGASLSLSLRPASNATVLSLQLATVADKCAWAPGISLTAYCAVPQTLAGANFLDNWYRGRIRTGDTWFRVDGSAGEAESFFTTNPNTALDVENPTIDETGNYIAFMDAHDKSLWVLRITE